MIYTAPEAIERVFSICPRAATTITPDDTGTWMTWLWRRREHGQWAYYTRHPVTGDRP